VPVVVLENQCWRQEAVTKVHIDDNDVMAAARKQGVTTLSGIKHAVVERNGSINIIKGQSDSSKWDTSDLKESVVMRSRSEYVQTI
jgi:uncharacterized membrane protein YcaP (DUF421 family)